VSCRVAVVSRSWWSVFGCLSEYSFKRGAAYNTVPGPIRISPFFLNVVIVLIVVYLYQKKKNTSFMGSQKRRTSSSSTSPSSSSSKVSKSGTVAATLRNKSKHRKQSNVFNWTIILLTVLIAIIAVAGMLYYHVPSTPTARTPTSTSTTTHQVVTPDSVILTPGDMQNVSCSPIATHGSIFAGATDAYDGCLPSKCARIVEMTDLSRAECGQLRNLADVAFETTSGGSGPASVVELHMGIVSAGENFVRLYRVMENKKAAFANSDIELYLNVVERVRQRISERFGVRNLRITSPGFLSQISAGKKPNILNDEYWHEHIDTLQYGSFTFTCLVYLNDHGEDFEGGEFVFTDTDQDGMIQEHVVAPSCGTLNFFTSGPENTHYVRKVTDGVRYALTIAFTCDPEKGIEMADYLSELRTPGSRFVTTA
jgi:2OG-Fe(II) oxygenase superfamily